MSWIDRAKEAGLITERGKTAQGGKGAQAAGKKDAASDASSTKIEAAQEEQGPVSEEQADGRVLKGGRLLLRRAQGCWTGRWLNERKNHELKAVWLDEDRTRRPCGRTG